MPSRSVYKGRRQKLVLAFDVGTSYSGISYSVLDPGKVPEIKGVTRFPAQEQVNGASKIPTIVYYDQSGKIRAVGAEAASEVIYVQAEEEKWVKVEWFKLHLLSEIQPLPLNKTVVEVFADFLAYLFKCASSYIQETHANGAVLWASVKDEIDFVLSHPNGWEGTEQSEMRKAAVRGGLIPDTSVGHARLSFVTEGEASLHFAIQNGLPEGAMKNGDGVIIVDAGGGTIDVGSYSRNVSAASKAVFEEMAPPRSHFYGSVFVTIHARQFLQNYLAESPFVDDIDHIVHCFDKTTKQRFIIAEDDQYIKFGSTRDNDAAYNIRFGQLKLLGMDVASFFKPSIDCIINAVMDQKTTSAKPISHVVLVGGFAANNYMFNLVHAALEPDGFNVLRPDSHVSKAVSDGAVSFYLDHFVQSRVSKPTHGNFCSTPSSYPGPTRDKAKEDYNKVCADLQRTQDSLQRTQNDLKTVESDIQELRHTNRDLVQDRVQMQDELKKAKREVEEYRKLLGIKERELLDASQRIDQVFPTKVDLLSASELSQKVSDLNEEVFQVAAWFSDSLMHKQHQWESEAETQSAYQTTCKWIGEPAARVLVGTASDPEPNPILVQLVMQIYFARFCSVKIECWYEGAEEINSFLSRAYGEIRRKEEQAVSSRWRGITRALTRPPLRNWTRELDFVHNLCDIMRIAGWELSNPDKGSAFEQQRESIFKAILDISIALGEHFTSADIEVYCPAPGAPFDPQCMEDALDDGQRKKDGGGGGGGGGAILGTAGIGLRDMSSRGAHSGAAHIVLLPKVILQSTLQELLQPPSAPRRTEKSKSTVYAG